MTAWHDGPEDTVDPGLLVRHLDGELEGGRADALERHLAVCEACRTLSLSLKARVRRLRETLERADVPVPGTGEWGKVLDGVRAAARWDAADGAPQDSAVHTAQAGAARATASAEAGPPSPRGVGRDRRTRRGLLAAGWMLALIGGATLASPPLRAWVAGQWTRWVHPDPSPSTPASAEAPSQRPGSAGLEFGPAGPAVEVVLEATQAGGTLTVRFGEEAGAARVSVRGGGDERLAVGGRGVRIANLPQARASYDVLVPRSVRSVSVRVGEGTPVELSRPGAGAGTSGGVVVIELDRGVVVREPGGS